MRHSPNPVLLRRDIDIGSGDAENDSLYLDNCFVKTGDVETILDCESPKCIILGRTGVGKTALIRQISKEAQHVAELSPEALSLHYITNSNVLRFFEEAGVHLDIFYSLLWRHIITVELLKLRFCITDEDGQHRFWESVKNLVTRDRAKKRALQYLSDWGSKFWTETEYRTTEFTRKLENDLRGSVKVHSQALELGAEGVKRLSQQEKIDVINHGTEVVNTVQVKELHDVVEFLSNDVFDRRFDNYYIVIDRLDEGWVDDKIRFKLIKSLIETVRTFKKVQSIKVILALRTDLLYRLILNSSDPGFQEEKYRSLYLNLHWTREQLTRLLDKRVSFMFCRQYTRQDVALSDIMPKNQMNKRSALDYILDRTFQRPREAIMFVNECIAGSEGSSRISPQVIRTAELNYSQQRVISIVDEWRREYPYLKTYMKLLERRTTPFILADISFEESRKFALDVVDCNQSDMITTLCEEFYIADDPEGRYPILETVMQALQHVGVIAAKLEPHLAVQWSFEGALSPFKGKLKPDTHIYVHDTFHAALGIARQDRCYKSA
jgi:hypothetical protein